MDVCYMCASEPSMPLILLFDQACIISTQYTDVLYRAKHALNSSVWSQYISCVESIEMSSDSCLKVLGHDIKNDITKL